jgi:hypothetical protein
MKAIQHHIFSGKNHIFSGKRSIAYPVMLSLVAVFTGLNSVSAEDNGYTYSKIVARGETAPGGDQYTLDFEPGQINYGGDLVFVADLPDGEGSWKEEFVQRLSWRRPRAITNRLSWS